MDANEMRRHLSGADPTTGQGGPAGGETQNLVQTLSVVSTDLGQLREQLRALGASVQKLEGDQEVLAKLQETVEGLSEAVDQLSAREGREPPPQPWNWSAMSWEEELVAIAMLATWVETHLVRWWPRVSDDLPTCWMRHPEMLRNLSLLYVSYQQAYEHPQARVHHEVDFRRTLEDMSRDIRDAVKRNHCNDKNKHVMRSPQRGDQVQAQQHIRRIAATAAFDADQAGDGDRATEIMERFKLTPQDLRQSALQAWPDVASTVTNKRTQDQDRRRAAKAAAHLLESYQVVDPTDLKEAPTVGAVLRVLYDTKDPRFAPLEQIYGATVRKFATIREEMGSLRPPTERGQALMARHGITDTDVTVVFNQLIR